MSFPFPRQSIDQLINQSINHSQHPHILPSHSQHYILAFGGIIAIPLILAEPLCIGDNNGAKSQLISTIFFVSGLCTLLQTAVGTR